MVNRLQTANCSNKRSNAENAAQDGMRPRAVYVWFATSTTRQRLVDSYITTATAIAFSRGREVNQTQWALGRYPWKTIIVLSLKRMEETRTKQLCIYAGNKSHFADNRRTRFVWLRNARCANISLSGWIRFHYIVTTIVCHVKTAAGFKVKGLYF